MPSFPLPVRVAAGLATTTLEQTRQLPRCLVGLPVTVTSQVLQLSMRLQQQVTELAIRGDEALAGLQREEEQPEWATFDEDETGPPFATGPPFETGPDAEPADSPGSPTQPDHASEVLPGYDQLTIPQLRGKLRRLSESDLNRLLEHERARQQRPEYLRMLSTRLRNLRSE